MAKRKRRKRLPEATKIEAVKAVMSGESVATVTERYSIVPSMLYNWKRKYQNGALGSKPSKAKANGHGGAIEVRTAGLTPEAMFDARVRDAIIYLRHAQQEVERLKSERKIKEPDAAHLLAQLALRKLQGDNGS